MSIDGPDARSPSDLSARHALHNYFIVKSLHLTRPGGLVALLTSRYTLDARNPAARHEIHQPGRTHRSGALPGRRLLGVLRDRRRLRPARAPSPRAGTASRRAGLGEDRSSAVPDNDDPPHVNEYYASHPKFVLGTLTADRGMYRARELTVRADGPLEPALRLAVEQLTAQGRSRGLAFVPGRLGDEPVAATPVAVDATALRFAQEGSFAVVDGAIVRVQNGEPRPHRPRVAGDAPELRRLVQLRDAAGALLGAQQAGASDPEVDRLQHELSERYDAYRRLYGPLNRYRAAGTDRIDPESGDEIQRRIRPRMGGFRDDPDWPLVAALEIFDDATQQAKPAPIFTRRIIGPPAQRLGVDTAEEAIAVCLDETGSLDLQRIAQLLGVDAEAARAEVAGLAWEDPSTGELLPASRYLSGHVRRKLEQAQAAAVADPRWEPKRRRTRSGSAPPARAERDHRGPRRFLDPSRRHRSVCLEVLGAEVEVERVPALGRWNVALRAGRRASVSLSSEWGTARADAVTLLDASLNQRLHTVTDEIDGRRVRNDAETIAARDKQDALSSRFASWIWKTRTERVGWPTATTSCSAVWTCRPTTAAT